MTLGPPASQAPVRAGIPPERVALVDLLDRLLAGGIVLTGDIVISIADVDLVHISLRALLRSIDGGGPSPAAIDGGGPSTAAIEGGGPSTAAIEGGGPSPAAEVSE